MSLVRECVPGFCRILSDSVAPFSTFKDCTPNPEHCGGDGGCEGATSELAFEYASKPLVWLFWARGKNTLRWIMMNPRFDCKTRVTRWRSGNVVQPKCLWSWHQRHGLHDSQHYSGNINRDLVQNKTQWRNRNHQKILIQIAGQIATRHVCIVCKVTTTRMDPIITYICRAEGMSIAKHHQRSSWDQREDMFMGFLWELPFLKLTASLRLKINGWKIGVLLGWIIF